MRSFIRFLRAAKRKLRDNSKGYINRVPKIFYCHVPKCAGSSLATSIANQVYRGYDVSIFRIRLEEAKQAAQIYSMDMMKVRRILLAYKLSNPEHYFGTGHVYCRPELVDHFSHEWNFVTILRNPVERWISEYVYNTYKKEEWMKNLLPIEEYLESEAAILSGTTFLRYFSNIPSGYVGKVDRYVKETIANLERFSIVGDINNLDGWCKSFKARFDRKITIKRENASPNQKIADDIRSNDSLMNKITKLCEPDLAVYEKLGRQMATGERR